MTASERRIMSRLWSDSHQTLALYWFSPLTCALLCHLLPSQNLIENWIENYLWGGSPVEVTLLNRAACLVRNLYAAHGACTGYCCLIIEDICILKAYDIEASKLSALCSRIDCNDGMSCVTECMLWRWSMTPRAVPRGPAGRTTIIREPEPTYWKAPSVALQKILTNKQQFSDLRNADNRSSWGKQWPYQFYRGPVFEMCGGHSG